MWYNLQATSNRETFNDFPQHTLTENVNELSRHNVRLFTNIELFYLHGCQLLDFYKDK